MIFKEIRIALIVSMMLAFVNWYPYLYHVWAEYHAFTGAWTYDDRSGGDGKMYRLYIAASGKEAGTGSGDHGGAFDHDDIGYVYNTVYFNIVTVFWIVSTLSDV